MGRMYVATASIAAHTAQIDYFEMLTVTEKPCLVHMIDLAQLSEFGDAQEEVLQLNLKRVTGAPTSGSGGSTAAAGNSLVPNDTAGSATFEFGNTTKLTGGTSVTLYTIGFQIRGGSVWLPPPEGRIVVAGATRLVLEEATTPADSITGPVLNVVYEELV